MALFGVALPRVWQTSPGGWVLAWHPSALAVVLVALSTLPIAVRRVAPPAVLLTVLAGVVGYSMLPGQPEPDYLGALIAVYTVAAAVEPRASRGWCALAALLLPVALAQTLTPGGMLRVLVLVALVWGLGLERRRGVQERERAAVATAAREARERELRTARRDLARRERGARDLHDILARSLTVTVVQVESLLPAAGARLAGRLRAVLDSSREALGAVHAAVEVLEGGVPERTGDWDELLAGFGDVGLVLDPAPQLRVVELDTDTGRCAYRVVQEGLTNALRHAGAGTAVRIDVELTRGALRVEVTSRSASSGPDGCVAPSGSAAAVGGYGLTSLGRDAAALGGELGFHPTVDGWRLWLWLPNNDAIQGGPPPLGSATVPGRPIRVVLVDDQAMILQGLATILRSHADIEVEAELESGDCLLDHLRCSGEESPALEGDPDRAGPRVVLLDLVMPGRDGLATLQALRDRPPPSPPRVLVLTTFRDDVRIRAALRLGAAGYVLKDGSGQHLVAAIRAVASGLTTVSNGAAAGAWADPARDPVAADTPGGSPDNGSPGTPKPVPTQLPEAVRRRLTAREAEVLTLLAEGLSNRLIARQLGVTEQTVKIHVSSVLAKLGVRSRTQAALLTRDESSDRHRPRAFDR